MKKADFRSAVFGMTSYGAVVMLRGPKIPEECGLYVHVEDIKKYEECIEKFATDKPEKKEWPD